MRPLWRYAWIFLASMSLLAACAPAPPPNILLIVIDTLRADRLGWYGGDRHLTPFLDSLAQRGTLFWRAYAQSSWTCPSVASLLTSRYQSQHHVIAYGSVLSETERSLPEVLQERGYATAAFVANHLLAPQLGYAQGFERYEVLPRERPVPQPKSWAGAFANAMAKERAERLDEESVAWLDALEASGRAATPVFLYMHYMEPHIPYRAPQEIVDRMISRHEDAGRLRNTLARMRLPGNGGMWTHPDADALRVLEDLYDAEVVSLDAALRQFFAALERRGFLSNAIVVITADHGEEFMDHGRLGHGTTLYEELIRVPLLVLSGGGVRHDIREVVSLIDVAPTVLNLAGIMPPSSFEGHSLKWTLGPLYPVARVFRQIKAHGAGAAAESAAYSQLLETPGLIAPPRQHDHAIVVGSQKLIAGANGDREAYDLGADPGEQHPNGLNASAQASLARAVDQINQRAFQHASPAQVKALDAQTKERMRALGYQD